MEEWVWEFNRGISASSAEREAGGELRGRRRLAAPTDRVIGS